MVDLMGEHKSFYIFFFFFGIQFCVVLFCFQTNLFFLSDTFWKEKNLSSI